MRQSLRTATLVILTAAFVTAAAPLAAQRRGGSGPVVSPGGVGYRAGGKLLAGKGIGKQSSKRKEICTIIEVREDGSLVVFNEEREKEQDYWVDEGSVLKAKRKRDFGKKRLGLGDLAEGQKVQVVTTWRSNEILELTVLEAGS